jgi:hypothetical protein
MMSAQSQAGTGPAGFRWRALECSVTGASHQRRGHPNQDASAVWFPEPPGHRVLVAVADGLGSDKYARSGRGSRLACDAAERAAYDIIGALDRTEPGGQPLLAFLTRIKEELAQRVVVQWRALVDEEPEPAGQEAPSADTGGDPAQAADSGRHELYASTLMWALLTERCCAFFHLGDGDMRVVSPGEEPRAVLPADPLLLGTSTTHLAMPQAWRHVRVDAVPTEDLRPRLVVAATDGLSTSFTDPATGLGQFIEDLDGLVSSEPAEQARAQLRAVLDRFSNSGSGDDITVAGAWRPEGAPAAGCADIPSTAGAATGEQDRPRGDRDET